MDAIRANAPAMSENRGSTCAVQGPPKQTPEHLHKGFAMAKGDGENSYSKNSKPQAEFNQLRQSALEEALEQVTLPSDGHPVVVADLGSSSSPNSITNVASIVDKLRSRLPTTDAEFQVIFNDLPSNDFNHLFQLLSYDGSFFAAGVPGSYFGRLLPRLHAHVFHSSMCLHWMSKIPDEVLNKNSRSYNGGNVWYMNSHSAVAEAYKQQAMLDLTNFLRAREAEMQPGGLLFLTFLARPNSHELCVADDERFSFFLDEVNAIWSDLISEGLLAEEKRDSFNFPVYLRSLEEAKEAIESYGGAFRVLTLRVERLQRSPDQLFPDAPDEELGVRTARLYRALVQDMFEECISKSAADIFWQRFEEREQKRLVVDRSQKFQGTQCVMSLIKL